MKVTGPLFKWFGSKWLSSRLLPEPAYDTVAEPFAGGAGYALRYHEKHVLLWDSDPHVASLWRWLIEEAEGSDIRAIPLNVPEGTDIRTMGLSPGQALLLKSWQRTNNVGDCWTVSPWGNKPGQWTANTRARVADQVGAVKHWRFMGNDGLSALRVPAECTWFIDPPYQFNYQYRQAPIDYQELSRLVSEQSGQRIVCEALCPKTGARPDWLPFKDFGERITSRRKVENNHHSKELIWETKSLATVETISVDVFVAVR